MKEQKLKTIRLPTFEVTSQLSLHLKLVHHRFHSSLQAILLFTYFFGSSSRTNQVANL